jgi:pimeloyl-ACP methyl ester carboxylesterase
MTRRALLWGGLAVATVVALVVAIVWVSLAPRVGDQVGAPARDAVPVVGADLTGSGPGSLVSATTMPGIMREVDSRKVQAARVVYRSTSGDGRPSVVSGGVFTPKGAPPEGGWPVIAYGHATTGIDEPCAPTLSESLLGSAQIVSALIAQGYAVALSDYQGLGSSGVHPYTDSRTAGLNMIDSVRALRATFKDVSNRWGAYGASQGGGAAWAADEQANSYAPELKIVGAVAISPAADVAGLVDKATAGTLTTDQEAALAAIIESLARLHPDFNRDDYRRGAAARKWDTVVACSGALMEGRNQAINAIEPRDISARTPEAADRLRNYLAQWALPQQRLSAPLLVWYGGTDTFIDSPWTAGAIKRASALGGQVVVQFEADKGHGEANYFDQLQWLTEQFAR